MYIFATSIASHIFASPFFGWRIFIPLELGSRSRLSNLVDPSKRRGQTGLDETTETLVAFWVVGEDRFFVRFVCLVVFVCLFD